MLGGVSRTKKRSLPVAAPRSRWTPELLAAVAEGERRALGLLLARDRGVGGAIAAASAACDRFAELERAATAREPPAAPIACRKGCSACCVSKVVITAPEVIRVADWLRRTLDEEALAALTERVRAADDRTRGLTRAERATARVPCPLLVDEACSVHEVRPLLCRGWTSLDERACARHFTDPEREPVAPAYVLAYELAGAVQGGLSLAVRDAGRDGALLELTAALRIALERPTAADRWLARLPVFSTARDDEGLAPPSDER